jgi:hypothetical protein
MSRHRAPADYAALKTGWKLLVLALGGVDAVAACTRATRSLASEYGSPNSDRFPPLDVVLDAETVAGEPHVLAVLARLAGYELVPTMAHRSGTLAAELQHVAASSATLFQDAAAALEHPTLSPAERERLAVDLDRLVRAAREAHAALRPVETSNPGKRHAAR